jgi:hypothetical protein
MVSTTSRLRQDQGFLDTGLATQMRLRTHFESAKNYAEDGSRVRLAGAFLALGLGLALKKDSPVHLSAHEKDCTKNIGPSLGMENRAAPRPSVRSRWKIGSASRRIRLVTVCEFCGNVRLLTRPNQHWCGQNCRQKAYRKRVASALRAALPARAAERREMKMARARERAERFRADLERHMERCRVSGCSASFDQNTKSFIDEILAALRA